MRHNIRLLYFSLACFVLIAGITAAILLSVVVFSTGPSFSASADEKAIISRTLELTQPKSRTEAEVLRSNTIWQDEITSGQLTLSEFLRVSFTGTQYLLEGNDDTAFAKDLAYAVYGGEDKAGGMALTLLDESRVYVIEQTLGAVNTAYVPPASDAVTDKTGTRILSVKLDQSIQDDEGYGFGVRKVSGLISIEGDQARTDFYIDDNLRPGQLSIAGDVSGGQRFSMLWDTRREKPGTHSVTVLMRTSDGRAQILTGGKVTVPSFFTLVNDGVQKGSIPAGATDVWYQLDALDRNAYINFVNLSADISVSLYDMYGNRIGRNDLPGTQTEVLRGRQQVLPQLDVKDPYVSAYQNIFYARVQKGSANVSPDEITYLCVQSKEVAMDADKNYLAVTSAVGIVPTPVPTAAISDESKAAPVICKDLNANTRTYAMSDLKFLPINGKLASLSFTDPVTAQAVLIYPSYDITADAYAYVSPTELTGLLSSFSCVEGYAASVKIEQESDAGIITAAGLDGAITITPSRNIIHIRVTDFDQVIHSYTLYLLSGADKDGYDTAVLSLFPQSYKSGIWLLHNLQPTYQFIPFDTGVSWADVMAAEDNKDKSLASDSTNPSWVKPDSPLYDGSSWRAAKGEVVSYFLDPRNFLNPVFVFQFEKLSFDPAIHTLDGVKAMVKGSFLETADPDYAAILLQAGSEAGISPYFLASRIIQEMGRQGESLLSKGTLPGYEGYFNFFNIGSTPDPEVKNGALINGAKYAMWGSDYASKVITPDEQALLLPWTSPDLAIRGGALWIARSYVDLGQNTLYFQKFDVINNADGLFIHQYAQNISMAYTEGARYHRAYLSQNMLASAFQFIIPVYLDMPDQFGILPVE
ncbi:MAG: hypothetical protein WCG21_06725 [Eubacteriales bacterium]